MAVQFFLNEYDIQVLLKAVRSYIRYERLVIKSTLDKSRIQNARENVSAAIKVLGLLKTAAELEKTYEYNKHD